MSAFDFNEFTKLIEDDLQQVVKPSIYEHHIKHKQDNDFHRMGVLTPDVRRIAKKYLKQLKDIYSITNIEVILAYCTSLQEKRIAELRTIATHWSFQYRKQLKPEHFDILAEWLDKYVTDWSSCDDLCVQTLGYFLCKYPEFIPKVKKWTSSTLAMTRRGCLFHIFST